MRVDPDPTKLFRPPSCIDLIVEEFRDGCIVKRDAYRRADLLNQNHVFDQQQIIGMRDPEAANFRVTSITQV
ncbi:MAG: hypothetical protein JWP89_6871 [Schlesneria sp.]|nr:hypothetical protein [Schlesneria sp.]